MNTCTAKYIQYIHVYFPVIVIGNDCHCIVLSSVQAHVSSGLKQFAIVLCFKPDKTLLLMF